MTEALPPQNWPDGPPTPPTETHPKLVRPPWHQRLHQRLMVAYALSAGPLMVVVYIALESLLRPHLSMSQHQEVYWSIRGILAAAYIVGILSVSFISSRTVSRPLAQISTNARRLATRESDTLLTVDREDELGALAESINYLSGQLNTRLTQALRDTVLLTTILNGMSEGVMVCDRQERVLLLNPAARRLLEVNDDPEGQHLLEVYRSPLLQNTVREVAQNKKTLERELILRRTNALHVAIAAAPLMREGECIGSVAVLHDITTLRQLERVRRDFVANVSHELRTPLATITGYAETLLSGAIDLDPMAEDFVQTIERHAKRLTTLVSDLLILARLEAQGEGPSIGAISFPEVIAEVIDSCEPLAERRGIKLHVALEEGTSLIQGESRALTQVLRNLVENGIYYSQEEGKEVSLRAWVVPDKDEICIQVKDSGVGIESQHLPRIFERFYRVDPGRSRDAGGTGLGLAIVKHMVLAMKGRIEVNSTPGEGSTFHVHLKLPIDQG